MVLRNEYVGQWWLPAAPKRRVQGTLTIRPRFVELDLESPLGPPHESREVISLVHGSCQGTELTLIGARPFLTFLLPDRAFQVGDTVLNAHLAADQLIFAEAHVEIDRLVEWTPAKGLERTTYRPRAKPGEVALKLVYTAQPSLEGKLDDGARVRLSTYPRARWGGGHVSLNSTGSISFRPPKRRAPFEMAALYVVPIHDLVSWSTQQPAAIVAAYLVPSRGAEPLPWIRAWRRGGESGDEPAGNIRFQASDLIPTFGAGLRAWMLLQKRCSEPLALLVSLLFAAPSHSDTALLLVAQALEAYHRCTFANTRWPDKEFKRRRREILDRFQSEADAERLAWLRELLQDHANDPPLSARLSALDQKAEPVLSDLFARRPDWTAQLRDMRDKFTHRGRMPPRYSAVELSELARFGRVVLDVCLMLDLGIAPDVIRGRAQHWSDFSFAMREAAERAHAPGTDEP